MKKVSATVLAALIAQISHAGDPSWYVFDAAYPEDAIDRLSVTFQNPTTVRFWERAGIEHMDRNGQLVYPTYTLTEIDCAKRTYRDLKWASALEAQGTPAGMAARAKFLAATQEMQKQYPSTWESIEPTKHSYARLDFVCAKSSSK